MVFFLTPQAIRLTSVFMFATIDIGTNSVLLLIGEKTPDGNVRVIEDRMNVTRLGEGLSQSGVISDDAAMRTLDTLREYLQICSTNNVSCVIAIGTAPLRNAQNSADFLSTVKHAINLDIEIISEQREAELSFLAASRNFGDDIVLIDIGGGSTELAAEDAEKILRTASLPIGCVSLTERFFKNNPVTSEELHALRTDIRRWLDEKILPDIYSRPNDKILVATAGTATTLSSMLLELIHYDPNRIHGSTISIDKLRDIMTELQTKTIEERKRLPGLSPERADVILAGAYFLHEAMGILGYSDVTISDRGVRWGVFYKNFLPS